MSLRVAAIFTLCLSSAQAQDRQACPDAATIARVREAYDAERYSDASDMLGKGLRRTCDDADALALRLLLDAAVPGATPPVIRQARRMELARRILAIDSTNAVANTVVGTAHVATYLAWRHALRPTLFPDEMEIYLGVADRKAFESLENDGDQASDSEKGAAWSSAYAGLSSAGELYARERFNVDALRARGVGFITMNDRADEAYPRAVRHLQKALRSDPAQKEALRSLSRLFAATEEWSRLLETAMEALAAQPRSPISQLAAGLALYHLRDLAEAGVFFESAFEADPDAMAASTDLSLLLRPSEVSDYRRDPASFSKRYWRLQNPRFLTSINERRIEHAARIAHAELFFSAPRLGRRGWETDRGQLYIRYGAPNTVHVFPFRFFPDAGSGGRTEIWDYDTFRFGFEDGWGLNEFRLFSPPAYAFANPRVDITSQDFVMASRERIREEPEQSRYSPARRVSMPALASQFKGSEGLTDVYVPFGVPVAEPPERRPLGLALRTGVFLLNGDGELVAEALSNPGELPHDQIHKLPQATLYVDSPKLSAPSGSYTLSVEFDAAGGRVAGFAKEPLEIRDYTSDSLSLSDLLLALQIEEHSDGRQRSTAMHRSEFEIIPAPWTVWNRQRPLYVYFETYGLSTDARGFARYDVETALLPENERSLLQRVWDRANRGQPDRGVSVTFESTSHGPDHGQYIVLDLNDQEPGAYILAIRIRQNGRMAQVERELTLE